MESGDGKGNERVCGLNKVDMEGSVKWRNPMVNPLIRIENGCKTNCCCLYIIYIHQDVWLLLQWLNIC